MENSNFSSGIQERLSAEKLKLLNHGLLLDGARLKPAQVRWLNENQLQFVLREGKKRQIRRMCELVGLKAIGLKRVRIGRVRLGALPKNFITACLAKPELKNLKGSTDPFEHGTDFLEEPDIFSVYESTQNNPKRAQEVLAGVAELMPKMHPYRAAQIALFCGSIVENGANPRTVFAACCDLMEKILEKLQPYCALTFTKKDLEKELEKQRLDNTDDPQSIEELKREHQVYLDAIHKTQALTPEQRSEHVSYQHGVDILLLPMMTMLMRDEKNFHQFIERKNLTSLVSQFYLDNDLIAFHNLQYLFYVSESLYGELIIILPSSQTGFIAKAHGINNPIHAVTLLQDLMAKNADVLKIGHIHPELKKQKKTMAMRYDWYDANAYQQGKLADSMRDLIRGDIPFPELAHKQGHIVLYAIETKELVQQKTWDEESTCYIYHSEQNPSIEFVRALTAEEVKRYMQ